MASADLSDAASSADIFSGTSTLAQIRILHRTLHGKIEEKATRLRTQVGGSYRELLGTADTIVQMRSDNAEVQELLGQIGGKCGRGVVGSKAMGLINFGNRDTDEEAYLREKARMKLLDNCALVAGRILKGGSELAEDVGNGDRLVLATKMLVLSRLLTKELDAAGVSAKTRPTLETSKKTLLSLRRRLTSEIERTLKKIDEDTARENLLKALCAYSLTTSSGAKDVLQYLLRIRGQAIAEKLEEEDGRQTKTEDVMEALKLYTRTLLDVQALVPLKLSQAFSALKKQPLLADAVLKHLEGLRLDLYEMWCGEDVQHFTPFIRHDDLDGKYARESLHKWAETGSTVLVKGLKQTLFHMVDFKSIMDFRTSVLQLWIREGGRAKGFDPTDMQDELREAVNQHMLLVLEAKVTKLRLVGSEIKATLDSWQDGVTDKHQGLWDDEDSYEIAQEQGAASLVQEVMVRLYGRNDAVSRAVNSYSSWYHVIGDVRDVVDELKKQRWDNDFDEVEDEETIDARQELLSQEDPNTLQTRLDATLDRCFKDLEQQIKAAREATPERASSGAVAMYLLRVLRDIRRQLPDRSAIKSFGLEMVPSLHETVIAPLVTPVIQNFAESGLQERAVVSRPLWEGEPALPNQPSPAIFQLLNNLSMAMADAGVDLWTSAAVGILKNRFGEQLAGTWQKVLDEGLTVQAIEDDKEIDSDEKEEEEVKNENEEEDGEKEKEPDDDDDNEESKDQDEPAKDETKAKSTKGLPELQIQELCTQWFFDLSLIETCITGNGKKQVASLTKLKQGIEAKCELQGDGKKRISDSAADFWQRTSLLFGLLA